ncbi:VOC family protein [bacterium]|nr:VOC family protein [bacterium]
MSTMVDTGLLISSLDYVTVMVKDQDAALNFYTGVLGFERVDDEQFGSGQRWLTVGLPGAQTRIVLFADPHAHADEGGCCGSGGCGSCGSGVEYAWTGMVMRTEDINAAFENLQGKGVTFLQPPQEKSWGVIDALFSDLDGNVFNLVQRKK